MKIIRIATCGECPYYDTRYYWCSEDYDKRADRYIKDDKKIHPNCPLEDSEAGIPVSEQECEWTLAPPDLEADKHQLFAGCRPRTTFPLAWDKIFPYCPCCGGLIKIKEAGDD